MGRLRVFYKLLFALLLLPLAFTASAEQKE